MHELTEKCGRSGHIGSDLRYVSHAIHCALDARIAAQVSPELTGPRGMVLGEILKANDQQKQIYQRDLEQLFHTKRSSVTAMLQGLEQDGFITRCAVAHDARLKSLFATEKGRASFERIRVCIQEFETTLLAGVTPEQLETTYSTLDRLLANIKKED